MEDHSKNVPSDGKPAHKLVDSTLQSLNKEYVIVGRSRVRSWRFWLVVGLLAGAVAGILWVANRSVEIIDQENIGRVDGALGAAKQL